MDVLKLASYKAEYETIEPGNTIRVDHAECSAGEDIRRRLYITRPLTDPTRVIGYCHNCQCSGSIRTTKHVAYRDSTHQGVPHDKTTTIVGDWVSAPPGMIQGLHDWPVHAQAWALRGRLTAFLCQKYHIQHDPSSNRVYIPRYHTDQSPSGAIDLRNYPGYQLRNTDPGLTVPKYLTVVSDTDKGFSVLPGEHEPFLIRADVLVIVEDVLSAIAIVEACNNLPWFSGSCLINYGTKVNLEALHLAASYKNVIVWLDNDSGHVVEQAECMVRTLKLLSTTSIISTIKLTDPKHHKPAQIADAMASCMRHFVL